MRLVSPGMRLLALALWLVAVVLVPLALLTGGPGALLFAILPSVFTAFFAWVVLWRPRVVATPDALVLVDVRRTSTISWRRVEEIRTRYGLEIVTSEGLRRTWVAPSGRSRLASGLRGQRLGLAEAAKGLRALAPEPEVLDGPPPATVTAAPLVHRVHGWTILALVVLGILASMSAARI